MPNFSTTTRAGAKISLPTSYTERNINTKMDDHAYSYSMTRREGESVTNFKKRSSSCYTRPGNSTINGITDSISRELNLGHEDLISVESSASLRLDVYPEYIRVSGAGTYGEQKVNIVDVDLDGYWNLPTIGKVVSGLVNISGISATVSEDLANVPAILLEEQSSYVDVYRERAPNSNSFKLGYYETGKEIAGTLISGTISFGQDPNFKTEVQGPPLNEGEWSLYKGENSVKVFSISQYPVNVAYTYSILESGMTMNLIGNGVKAINLMQEEVQNMLFKEYGAGATAKSIINELRIIDGSFWGM